jgi:hypothetical protein
LGFGIGQIGMTAVASIGTATTFGEKSVLFIANSKKDNMLISLSLQIVYLILVMEFFNSKREFLSMLFRFFTDLPPKGLSACACDHHSLFDKSS